MLDFKEEPSLNNLFKLGLILNIILQLARTLYFNKH